MDVVFYTSPKQHRLEIAKTFAEGVKVHGDQIKFRPLGTGFESKPHVGVIIGNKTRWILDPLKTKGYPIVCLDRAYPILNKDGKLARDRSYSRITVNGTHPVYQLGELDLPDDRRQRFNWNPKPWRKEGHFVLFAGSALSYYMRTGVTEIREYTEFILGRIREYTKRPVLFRPKPNIRAEFGDDGPHTAIAHVLDGCHVVVVEESSVSLEALLMGIPAIVIGPSPTRPISSITLDRVDNPDLASDEAKRILLSNLAYFQYNQDEYRDGTAWGFIRRQF